MPAHNYCLVVKGELGPRYASAFEDMTIRAHDGVTEITGEIIDPSHLQGLITRVTSLGLILHSITPLEQADSHTHDPPAQIRMTD
jgi:hypothetical protein